jgi:hypothetical protein
MILLSEVGIRAIRSTPTHLVLPLPRWGGLSYFYLLWRCSWLVFQANEQTVGGRTSDNGSSDRGSRLRWAKEKVDD